ncbi:MAG: DNA polymerase I [Ruminococcaceae bacterium]|nr:DNA polymerase I [Oscillospiraceae bacterium]
MEKLLIIDGNSIANRAFYGIRPLTTKEGIPTNAVFGFLNIVLKVIDEEKPDYITVAFDVSKKTFRNDMYDLYKANRSGMPDDLAAQMPILKEVLDALNISHIGLEGYEADDLIGTVSKKCESENISCRILTGDRDDLQLCSDTTTVLLVTTQGGKTQTVPYNPEAVVFKYGVTPKEFIDLKGLMGDSSDNIPGVKGVGEKTAITLISEFKSIEKLYENIDSPIIKKAAREKLIADKEMAYLSKELATIKTDVPIALSLENFRASSPSDKALELFKRLELNSFIKRLSLEEKQETAPAQVLEFKDNLEELMLEGCMYYLIDGDYAYINASDELYKVKISENTVVLKKLFENESIGKVTYSAKEDIISLASRGITLKGEIFDIKLAAYLIDPSGELRPGSVIYLGAREDAEDYEDYIVYLPMAYKGLFEKLKSDNLIDLYYDIELPVMKILASMELRGIKIDVSRLNELSKQFEERISELTFRIYKHSGEEFNINSTKQLSVILFEKLGLKAGKKTKTGYSTDSSVLEGLKGEHPIIDLILEYRTIAKLKSTYVDGILPLCDEEGILHSKFHQTVTQTGRLSSSEPNLQNIPVRIELGRQIRRLFTPAHKDNVFISADYSQVELRVLAQICGDEYLIDAFKKEEDIHKSTAARIYSVSTEEVTSEMRSNAKTVNFGLLYGKTEFTLAKDLGISRKAAKEIIDTYFEKYPKIRKYMFDIVDYAKKHGYVKTLLGRIRYIKELSDRNYMTRLAGERMALNTPIQGTAADIMKIAMIKTERALKKNNINARIVLQIHDELVLECSPEDLERAKTILKESMENAVKINVPLTVSLTSGTNLYELK